MPCQKKTIWDRVKWQKTLRRRFIFAPFLPINVLEMKISGETCPSPGSLPHGNWTCEMQEIQIHGTSFLDEDAQPYPGEEFGKFSYLMVWNQGTSSKCFLNIVLKGRGTNLGSEIMLQIYSLQGVPKKRNIAIFRLNLFK